MFSFGKILKKNFGKIINFHFDNVFICVIGEEGDLRCEATETMSGPR